MINKVLLLGHLTADPEVRISADGLHVANVRLATNTYAGRDEAGNRREHTEYHRLVIFGKGAETAGALLRKGRLVYVAGRLQTRSWDDKEGQKHTTTEIVVDEWLLVGPREQPAQAA